MLVDCHVHIFDPARHPYRENSHYRPLPHDTATLDDLRGRMDRSGVTHAVLVGPTAGYGPDNACLIDALRRGGPTFRGIAVLDADPSDEELDELAAVGVVGARFDLIAHGVQRLAEQRRLVDRLLERQWIINMQCTAAQIPSVDRLITSTGGRFVIDHGGRPDPSDGADAPGFRRLLGLLSAGAVWIKLSAPFRASRQGEPFLDMDPFFREIVAAAPADRLLWGSDWPFVRMEHRPDYARTLAALDRWVPESRRHAVLSRTPARLFGWPLDD